MMMQKLPGLTLLLWSLSCPLLLAAPVSTDRPPNTGGRSAGSRGCPTLEIAPTSEEISEEAAALMLLAPPATIAQTASSHPTFGWFVRDSGTWPMAFRIYRYARDRGDYDLITEVMDDAFQSAQGLNVLSLSESMPALLTDEIYLWQVELICDPSQPSGNLFAEAEIQVVRSPPALQQHLNTVDDAAQQVTLYHEAGFWYDALGITLTTSSVSELSELRARLLESISLNPNEAKVLRESSIQVFQR